HPHLQAVAVAKDIPAKKEEDESAAGYEFKNLLSKNMPASPDDMVLNKFAKRVNRRMFKPIEVRVRWEGRFQHVTSFQARPFWTLFDFKVYLVKRWLWQEDRLDAFTVINWREPNRGQDTKLGKFKLPYFIMMDNLIRTTFPPNPPESPENRSEDAALPMPCLAPALQAAESKKRAAPEPPPRPSTKKIRIYLGLDGHFVDVQDGFASRSNGWSRIRKHPETQVVLIRDNSGSDPEQQWYSPTESSEDSESRSQQETQLVERTADSAIVRIRFPWIHGAAHNAKDAPHTHGGTSSIEPSDADLALDDYEDMIATIKGCGRSPRSSSPVPDAAAAGRGSYHDYNNATINPWVRNSFNASRLREDQPPDVMQKNHQGSSPFEMPRELRRRTAVELKTRSPERMRPNVSECKVADHASPPVGLSPQQADGAPNRIEVKQIAACGDAFAAILANGSVLTNAATHAPTKGVQNIQATRYAFAAILDDGSVQTWGDPKYGGDSMAVQHQLQDVQSIQATASAFAALLGDGSIVAWGSATSGGDSTRLQNKLSKVQQVQASEEAFAAILVDGSVVTWGEPDSGGDSSKVQESLHNVTRIQASQHAFAAIRTDGSVVTWGRTECGGNSSAAQGQLQHVQHIQATDSAFAAIRQDGSVITWGAAHAGGNSDAVRNQLKHVKAIQSTIDAFAAIRKDGSVITWGNPQRGGDSSTVHHQLKQVRAIQASEQVFAAILVDGSVVTWGCPRAGGDSSAVQRKLKGVRRVQAADRAFAAILADGSVVTWGIWPNNDENHVNGVRQLQASQEAFAAVLKDGSFVAWGNAAHSTDKPQPSKSPEHSHATRTNRARSYHDYNNATINPWVRNSFNASRLREVKLVCTGETNKLTAEERQKYRCHPLRQQAVRLADRITRLIWSTLSQSIQRWWRPAQVMDMIQDVLQVQLHFVEKEQLAQMTDDLLESAATLSWQLETSSSAASRRQQHRTGFMSASMPRITLTEYLQHLYRQLITRDLDEAAPLPCSVLVTAAALLQRLQNAAPEVFHPFSLRRLWATAFTLAYAWLADSSIHWPTMAALTGLQNGLDLERTTSLFLQLIDWRCFVSQETYQQTCLNIAQSTFPRPRLSRPREEPVALADQDRHATSAEPSSKDDNDEPVQQQTEKGESRDVEAPEPYTLDRHVTAPPKASRAPVFRRKINLVLATLAGRSRETTVHKYISLAYFSQKDGSVLNVIQIRQTKPMTKSLNDTAKANRRRVKQMIIAEAKKITNAVDNTSIILLVLMQDSLAQDYLAMDENQASGTGAAVHSTHADAESHEASYEAVSSLNAFMFKTAHDAGPTTLGSRLVKASQQHSQLP
ncbi:Herc2, partial [Symbiodinium sp. KB8]